MAGNGMKGMVIEEGERIVKEMGQWKEAVDTSAQAVQTIITALEAAWMGPDVQAAIEMFQQILEALKKLAEALEHKTQELQKDIEEQTTTSSQ